MKEYIPLIISILSLIVTIVSVTCAVYFASKSKNRVDTKDIEERIKNDTRINMKLDSIGTNVSDIKTDISSVKEDIRSIDKRLVKVEESVKSAHHRIDGIEHRESEE